MPWSVICAMRRRPVIPSKIPPQYLAVSIPCQRQVGYNVTSGYERVAPSPKLTYANAPLVISNLSVGTESVGSLETFQTDQSRVGRFIERERTSEFLPIRESKRAAYPRQNYVRDGRSNRNPGNECVIDRTITNRVRVIVPSWSPNKVVSRFTVRSTDSPGFSEGRGTGRVRAAHLS